MEEAYNLLTNIKSTIRWIADRNPTMYHLENNFVAVFWPILSNQDSIYEMFNSKDNMDFYYNQIKHTFEQQYPNLCLDVKYNYGPVEYNSTMYSQIIYYYYDKEYYNSNVYFLS
jgi:hypothetical protein